MYSLCVSWMLGKICQDFSNDAFIKKEEHFDLHILCSFILYCTYSQNLVLKYFPSVWWKKKILDTNRFNYSQYSIYSSNCHRKPDLYGQRLVYLRQDNLISLKLKAFSQIKLLLIQHRSLCFGQVSVFFSIPSPSCNNKLYIPCISE